MSTKTKLRSPAMDVIRCTALACVAGVHFFLNTGFYNEVVAGPRMLLMTMMRSALMVCVPLFLMLSGYLMKRHRPCAAYYGKLCRTLGTYALVTVLSGVYRTVREGAAFSPVELALSFVNYQGSNYGWYIEMYIGLFLLAPFLNILYEGVQTEKGRRGLILTLLFLTALPGVVNVWKLRDPGWFADPTVKPWGYTLLIPDWWVDLYPVTYYFLGAYLRDHPLKLSRGKLLAALTAAVLFNGLFNIYRSHGAVFVGGEWQYNGSLLILIQSVLLFAWLAGGSYDRMGPKLRMVLAKISGWSLGAYLVSWIFDREIYRWLAAVEPDVRLRLNWFPVTVPAVLICSVLTAAAIDGVYSLLARAGNTLRTRLKR